MTAGYTSQARLGDKTCSNVATGVIQPVYLVLCFGLMKAHSLQELIMFGCIQFGSNVLKKCLQNRQDSKFVTS